MNTPNLCPQCGKPNCDCQSAWANSINETVSELDNSGESIRCDQCEALMINGVFCHETGCPNTRAKYIDGQWVKFYECFHCGFEVREGEVCDCQTPTDNDSEVL